MPGRHLDRRLKPAQLRLVEALATHGSLLKASAALGLGQPALTRALRELEALAGHRLFERHARGVRPTEAGVLMIREARALLALLRRLDEALDGVAGAATGRLALGVLPVASVGVLPGALARLSATHPGLRLRLEEGRTEELLPRLAAREIDLVVGRLYEPPLPDGFLRRPMWEEPLAVIARAGHPLRRRRGPLPGAALARHPLLLPTTSQRLGQEIERFLGALGLSGEAALRSSSHGFIREMLLGGEALAVMPRHLVLGDLLRGALCALPVAAAGPPRPAGVIMPPDPPPSPAARAFLDALSAHLAEVAQAMPESHSSRPRSDGTRRRPRG
ncbi:LysR substrate-binding domain-containing protein [Rubritepida flocculans]|uniref:LysR substrate-binding domain-containing protein n=1 Tax=Rubritepida flocculans TaxID=182403 RepID=UPI0004108411|nr:LysR substrate-binding domain-containing protein [Rubritepida flocculans]